MLENIILTEEDKKNIKQIINKKVFFLNPRNINPQDFKEVEIDGNKLQVMNHLEFKIFIGAKCNSNCPFCINKALYTHENTKDAFSKNKLSPEEFIKRFDYIYAQLTKQLDFVPFVMLTGGEPTINTLFVPFIQHLARKGIRFDMLTNGSALDSEYEGKPIIEIMAPNCGGMQISRAHYDDDINQKIMNLRTKPTNDSLLKSIKKMRELFDEPYFGMSCMLMKNGIHTVKDIKTFIETYRPFELSDIAFRQMENIFEYTSDGQNNVGGTYDEIKEELEKDPDFRLDHVENVNDYYNYNYWYKEEFRICFSIPSSMKERYSDNKICDHIDLYPDGKVYYNCFYSLPVK